MNIWETMKIIKFHNKKLIYTLPQAPFSQQNNEQIMNKKRIHEKHNNSQWKAHIYFAAGGSFPKKYSKTLKIIDKLTNHENNI